MCVRARDGGYHAVRYLCYEGLVERVIVAAGIDSQYQESKGSVVLFRNEGYQCGAPRGLGPGAPGNGPWYVCGQFFDELRLSRAQHCAEWPGMLRRVHVGQGHER